MQEALTCKYKGAEVTRIGCVRLKDKYKYYIDIISELQFRMRLSHLSKLTQEKRKLLKLCESGAQLPQLAPKFNS